MEDLVVKAGSGHLEITSVPLTFGRRYYFRCPLCHQCREAIYLLGGYAGCRKCLRLGYRSQSHDRGMIPIYERMLLDRSTRWRGLKLAKELGFKDALEEALRWRADKLITAVVESISIS